MRHEGHALLRQKLADLEQRVEQLGTILELLGGIPPDADGLDRAEAAAAALRSDDYRVSTLAVGTTGGAPLPLPGGDFPHDGFEALVARLAAAYPFLAPGHARRLARAYGTEAFALLGAAGSMADLGRDFGATLTEAEIRWLMKKEYARRAEDVVWRRSKLGLRMTAGQIAELDAWMQAHPSRTEAA